MARAQALACIDIGKTNRRLVLIDCETRAERDILVEPNGPVLTGPYPALDLDGTMAFIEAGLAHFATRADIRSIAISAHGAAFVAMAGDRAALPALDYEHSGPDELARDYAALRPPFEESFSPSLPGGLNAGRGLHWLMRRFPEAFARVDALLSLNQYIAFRLTGVRASECTSLGCHTDLWDARAQGPSSLVRRLGWEALLPPLRRAGTPLGPLRADIARAAGLSAETPVLCGIHDSNATLVPYLAEEAPRATVFSTGTWIIGFSLGGGTDHLDEARDCLANSDYLGRPVPSARMMGGREFGLLTGGANAPEPVLPASAATIPRPGFVRGTGPFGGRTGSLPLDWSGRAPAQRATLASLYCAFNCATLARLIDGAGPVIVEGIFARNRLFTEALAAVTGAQVRVRPDATGSIAGLTVLAGLGSPPDPVPAPAPLLDGERIRDLHRDWLAEL